MYVFLRCNTTQKSSFSLSGLFGIKDEGKKVMIHKEMLHEIDANP